MRTLQRGSVLPVLLIISAGFGVPVLLNWPAGASEPQTGAPRAAEPPLVATPAAHCGPGSRPETGLQGRVSPADHNSGRAARGFRCNTKLVGSYTTPNAEGTVGGFKVERYVDAAGHECAYYDATLLFPINAFDSTAGVQVLDMSNPAKPILTERLLTPAMQSPHESLVLSQKRGLLAAVLGNPAFNVGVVDVYDVSEDCRHPVLRASAPIGVFGHESGMSPDGRTFYSASPATKTIVAVDISNPSLPVPIWNGSYDSHGLSIGRSGDRAYVAGINSGLIILDTSEIQARKPNPTVREITRLRWGSMSIPQIAIPVTIDGHRYVVEIDEYGGGSEVGAARIIDIANEARPRVISNLRLEVHQPKNFDLIADDPGASLQIQGYAGHYCNVPRRTDPGIVACSMILSGLRVFDIRDPYHPREIAYFNAPVISRSVGDPSNYAMSSPSFVPKRGEIWYTDGFSGFYNVRVTNGVWPFAKCNGKDSTVGAYSKRTTGTAGNDVIVGRRSRDAVIVKRGKDIVCARRGNDLVKGGSGKDTLFGQGGRDRLIGGGGNDILRGGRGADRIGGGAGRDRIFPGEGRNRVDCGPGRDVVIAHLRSKIAANCERVILFRS